MDEKSLQNGIDAFNNQIERNEMSLEDAHKMMGIDPEVEEVPTSEKANPITNNPVQQPSNVQPTVEESKIDVETARKLLVPEEKFKSDVQKGSAILNNIKVDLNNISIVDNQNSLTKMSDMSVCLSDESVYQVICNQSAYIAFMKELKYADISKLNSSSLDPYNSRVKVYQTVYNKIQTTSLGKITYEEFLKITSLFDFDTLLFGLYQQSFPGKTDLTLKCKDCKKKIDAKIDNNQFISVKDDKVYANIKEIINSCATPLDSLAKSTVSKTNRVLLEKSKIIVDIKIPTLEQNLKMFASINKEKFNESIQLMMLLLTINKLYMLDVNRTVQTGTAQYYEIKDMNEKASIIQNLAAIDYEQLLKQVQEIIDSYAVEYKISSFKCPHCGSDLGDISVDMEDLLFTRIQQ